MRTFEELYNSAASLRDLGDFDKAIDLAVEITNLFPEQTNGFRLLAGIYFEMEKFDLAIEPFRKVLSNVPHSEIGSVGLFVSLIKVKKYDEAFDELVRYFKLYNPVEYKEVILNLIDPSWWPK